jgi:glycosyltransferase involved in cell wall biosynthesis
VTSNSQTSATRPLHVALTVDPNLPVPPRLYGGIERIVDFLIRGLVERGHSVTLFAHPGSTAPATLVAYGIEPHRGFAPRLGELAQVGGGLWRRRHRIDLIHSFGRLAALVPVLGYRSLPKIQSYQRESVPWRSVRTATRLAGSSLQFTACSTSVYATSRPSDDRSAWTTIFNGVDSSKFKFQPRVDDRAPLAFLGRLEPIKGAHDAISIAKATGRRLVLAGNRVETGSAAGYFEREIAPHIDGEAVRYVGPVDDAEKNALLGAASALLMPIGWEEPFGIVMAEAFACGTPVIAYRRGSVPEVVREGVNGFTGSTVRDAVRAVGRLHSIDRRRVRSDCEARFSHRVIVDQYESLYRELISLRQPIQC